jgi:SAM-dependent methyltransferase
MTLVRLRKAVVAAEGWWFDWRRHVRTGGYLPLDGLTLAGGAKPGHEYLAVRPRGARAALADLPLRNHADYAFVDLGSGKGRMLFLAAEYPFRRITGVELARELHDAAVQNIRSYRSPKQRCRVIESIYMDAAEYLFPDPPLVISLFNPFGPGVLREVLDHLNASAAAHPREIVLILLNPEAAHVVDTDPHFRVHKKTRSYNIYQRQ